MGEKRQLFALFATVKPRFKLKWNELYDIALNQAIKSPNKKCSSPFMATFLVISSNWLHLFLLCFFEVSQVKARCLYKVDTSHKHLLKNVIRGTQAVSSSYWAFYYLALFGLLGSFEAFLASVKLTLLSHEFL